MVPEPKKGERSKSLNLGGNHQNCSTLWKEHVLLQLTLIYFRQTPSLHVVEVDPPSDAGSASDSGSVSEGRKFMCEKEDCIDFRKIFKYKSQKLKHEK